MTEAPRLRDEDVRRILRHLHSSDAAEARLVSHQWRHVFDATWPGGVRRYAYENVRGIDMQRLGMVHTVDLRGTDVSDVSMLGGVHTLSLFFCRHVRDVSSLGSVHTLDISGCDRIKDYSVLSGVCFLRVLYLRCWVGDEQSKQLSVLRENGVTINPDRHPFV